MPWTQDVIDKYHTYTKTYIFSYDKKIDCADLALSALVDFAVQESLPVRLKFFSPADKKWQWMEYNPKKSDAKKFKRLAMVQLGALNVIDNSMPINIGEAKAGDLIMSKWNGTLGHTRIIYSTEFDPKKLEYKVNWYQGNLPPVIPESKTDNYSKIQGVFGDKPRRWNFSQFDAN